MLKPVRLQLPDKLGSVFEGNADYRGAYGGRGAAKTIGFAKMAIKETLALDDKPWRFLCGRELQKSLKDSVFSVIASQIQEMGVEDAFDVGKEFIRCKNGNEFLFYGLKSNIAEVKGLHGVRRTWLEEAQKVSQSSLTYLIPTVMRDFPDCELWASWNPDDEEDPIHKMMVTDADSTVKCVKINYNDNPWFPDSLNKVRLRDLKNNPQRYEWIWEGNFNLNAEGAVYAKWMTKAEKAGRIRTGIYDPALPVHTVWDLGYSDDTAIWWFQVQGNEIRLIDYYESNREGIKHYAEQIYGHEIPDENIKYGPNGKITAFKLGKPLECSHRAEYTYGQNYVPHDAANKLLQAGGRSVVDQLFELGIKCRVAAATSQQNQIEGTRNTLDFCWFDPERCKDGIRSLRKYQFKYDENKASYSKEPDHDLGGYSHGCDAFEIIAQVWKSAKKEDKPEKPRFLHEATLDELWSNKSKGLNRL
jgi:phage terminase large subunit